VFDRGLFEARHHARGRAVQEPFGRGHAGVGRRGSTKSQAGHDSSVRFLLHVRPGREHDAIEQRTLRCRVHQDAGRFLERNVHVREGRDARRVDAAGNHQHVGRQISDVRLHRAQLTRRVEAGHPDRRANGCAKRLGPLQDGVRCGYRVDVAFLVGVRGCGDAPERDVWLQRRQGRRPDHRDGVPPRLVAADRLA
jgi:hypothetical protein